MKVKTILSLIILGLCIQCKEAKSKKNKQKIEQISAINHYNFFGKSSFKFQYFSDSSYVFTIIDKDVNHEKFETFNDFCYSKNDTIYFSQTRFRYNGSDKAVIKNNYIEFIRGDFPLKIEITKNLLQTKNKLNLEKFNDYAFFIFEPNFHERYFHEKTKTLKSADLDQKELIELDQILKKCFSEKKSKLENFDKYIHQCIVVTTTKGEKEVLINSYCKDPYNKKDYKYSLIQMDDGGNCNVSLIINLTKHNYSDLSISGSA
ncbi:hypothetical protein NU08_3210 [Flavobacterium anhuiense]|uniref:Uncharacterized protein n=1 Tax=Flavobacterium anhuiense TaxID=459526 RepID=A0A444VVH5_9FLAO|nr:hypothetical protein [Flavobacterium anhuiense]RYJ37688.1 hypothetical protein NU08_3210 [Flavobacterium anhuiense]